jgi:hypothetical protein
MIPDLDHRPLLDLRQGPLRATINEGIKRQVHTTSVAVVTDRMTSVSTRIPQMDWCSASPVHQFWLKNQDLTLDQGSRVLTDATGERGNP